MKYFKFLITIITFICVCILGVMNPNVYANKTNLGIDGYDGITYDPCIPYGPGTTETTDSYGEKWYLMNSLVNGVDTFDHIDDDIFTVYYRFIDDGDPNDELWVQNYQLYMDCAMTGFDKWNYVSAYKENEDGTLEIVPVVNFVNVATLDDPDSVEVNVDVHLEDGESYGASGEIVADYSSEVVEDRQEFNGVQHIHYTKYIITLYPHQYSDYLTLIEDMIRTAAHEMGHLLGLADIDYYEADPEIGYHHQEVLMGYPYLDCAANPDVTYRDLAGVLIARGIHTNEDHKWLYDIDSSVEGSHKLICSICNCVKYVSSIRGYNVEIYKDCDDCHTLDSGNMMPVARFANTDYWKCKYCKHVEPFDFNVEQNYRFLGEYDDDQHFVYNEVTGLTYYTRENHRFNVDLGNGVKKCYMCPMCDDGSIHIDYDEEVNMNCLMDSINKSVSISDNSYKLYKLDVDCKHQYVFNSSSSDNIVLEIFDENMRIVDDYIVDYSTQASVITNINLDIGTYYLRVRYEDFTKIGTIDLNIGSNGIQCRKSIDCLNESNVLTCIHGSHAEYIYNDNFDRFVQVNLNVLLNDTDYSYPAGSITIKDKYGNIVSKFGDDVSDLATSRLGQNSMFVFLEKNTDYIINIDMDTTGVESAILSLDFMDVIEYDTVANEEITVGEITNVLNDQFTKIDSNQLGRFTATLNFVGEQMSDLKLAIVRKGYTGDDIMYHNILVESFEDANSNSISISLNCTSSVSYYVGIFGGTVDGSAELSFYRFIANDDLSLRIDPDAGFTCGSEVYLNGGAYNSSIITRGHSRCLYIHNTAPSNSRLDYYWYSSNPNLLTVTNFGTVIATSYGEQGVGYITAVYKYNFSYVYQIPITVVEDTRTDPFQLTFNINLNVGDEYQFSIDQNWPTYYLQHYFWESSNVEIARVSQWGIIYAISPGVVEIRGDYLYNSRYSVVATVTIT